MKYVFGVDIGGTTVKLGLFDEKGELLDKWEIPTDKTDKGKNIVGDVCDSIKSKISGRGITAGDVMGVGVGAPGAVDEDGVMTGGAVNLGWDVFNLRTTMEEKLDGIKVVAGNDANVAAYGEMLKGGGKGHKNVVAVTLGTGVGGGVIIGGRLITGATGAAGEIGHIRVDDEETLKCNCGHTGCLEQFASATGIARLAKRRLEADDKASVLRSAEVLDAKAVFDALGAKTYVIGNEPSAGISTRDLQAWQMWSIPRYSLSEEEYPRQERSFFPSWSRNSRSMYSLPARVRSSLLPSLEMTPVSTAVRE